jgi:hypothetical protein
MPKIFVSPRIATALFGATFLGLCAQPAQAVSALVTYGPNLVVNGNFERPELSSTATPTASIFPTSIQGWTGTNGIEIHKNIFTPIAEEGPQYAELDVSSNTSISQQISVSPGRTSLSGNTIFSLSENGVGLGNTAWRSYSYDYTPSTSSVLIRFTATGDSDSLGVLVDGISYVQEVPGPLPVLGPLAILGSFRRLRQLSSTMRLRRG